jgi:hypothetical protein
VQRCIDVRPDADNRSDNLPLHSHRVDCLVFSHSGRSSREGAVIIKSSTLIAADCCGVATAVVPRCAPFGVSRDDIDGMVCVQTLCAAKQPAKIGFNIPRPVVTTTGRLVRVGCVASPAAAQLVCFLQLFILCHQQCSQIEGPALIDYGPELF